MSKQRMFRRAAVAAAVMAGSVGIAAGPASASPGVLCAGVYYDVPVYSDIAHQHWMYTIPAGRAMRVLWWQNADVYGHGNGQRDGYANLARFLYLSSSGPAFNCWNG